MRRVPGRCFALFTLLFAVVTASLFAQAVSGTVFGTVTDNTGAPVPGASITVTDVAKGTTFKTTANESGNYTVTRLIPDVYQVAVEAKGFDRFTQDNVSVSADQGVKVDAALKVGRVETNIEVTGAPPLLKTDRADVSDTISNYDLVKLPVTNRNFTDLELTLPGAVQLGWQHASSENPQGSAQIQVNGQQFSSTDYMLDGTDNRDPILGIIVINPNLDAVQEVKMTTTDFDAEFGSGAAIMGAQTKSGTNQFHGTAFDYLQNDKVNARDPFAQAQPDPASGKLVPPLRYNQFGVTGGGAIVKDKLFYFGDYQGVRRNRGASLLSWVPTAAERGGDFSSVLGAFLCSDGSTPNTPCALPASPVMVTNQQGISVPAQQNMIFDPATGNSDGSGRQVFSFGGKTNVIDPLRFDSAAVKLLNLLPMANLTNGNPAQDYSSAGAELFHQNGFDARIDYTVNGANQIFGRYSVQQFFKSAPGAFGVEAGGASFPSINFAGLSHVRNQSMALGYDHTFTPTLLSEFRFGFFRYRVNVDPNGLGSTPATDAGAPGLNTGDLFTSAMPAFYINNTGSNIGSTQLGYALGVNQCNCPLRQNEVQLQWVGNITKIVGNHQIKWGADIRHADQLRVPSDAHRAGELSFNQGTTGIFDTAGLLAQSGEGFASYLLGLSGGMTRFVSTSTTSAERQNRLFFYGQDTYRFTPTITINYGLRWEEYRPQYVNGKGQGGWFDFGNANIMVAGVGPINLAGNVKPSYKQFAPRIGIAWQARPQTVLRVGYGRSYDVGVFGSLFGHTVSQNLPVLAFQNVQAPNSFQPAFSLSTGPPSPASLFAAAVPNPSTGEFQMPDGVNVNADERQIHVPSVDSWNATVEQQFGTDMVLDLSYLGNIGHHLTQTPDFNQRPILTNAQMAADSTLGDYRPWASLGIHPAAIPLPNSGVFVQCNCDSDNYHALQARFNKKLSHGYDVFSNYTWSKAMGFDGEYLYNWHQGYGPQGHDITHNLNIGQTWTLPVGRGQRWLHDSSGALDAVLGGWTFSSETSIHSGLPYSVWAKGSPCPGCPFGIRAIAVSSAFYPSDQSGAAGAACLNSGTNCWLSGAAFANPPTDPTTGVVPQGLEQNQFRGPSFWNTNAALDKTFNLTERFHMELRGEVFNLFNHANLGYPDSSLGDYNPNPAYNNRNLFGTINSIAGYAPNSNAMRYAEFALRFSW